MNSAVFNQVAALLGTTDKNMVFTVILKNLLDAGLTVKEAYEVTFGPGSFEKMAGIVYESLQTA